MDRGRSPFEQVVLCKNEPGILFCLHDNGSISSWGLVEKFKYEMKSLWELQRFTKQNKKSSVSIYGILKSYQVHTRLAMFSSDGFYL